MPNVDEEKARYSFKTKLDVRWSDMDELGHVNNAVYLTYFEQARIEYLHHVCKWDWKETGAILANAHVDYHRPLRYPAPTFVYVRTSKLGTKSFEISYLIVSQTGEAEQIMTTGYTTMVMYDYDTNKTVSIPERIRQEIEAFEAPNF